MSRRGSSARSVAVETVLSLAFDLAYCLILALPVMWLSAFLHDQGWPVTPLSYWASYFVAFLLGWVIDGSGTMRRALEDAKR